ncbi:MAG: hypothetical protein ACOVQC_10805 [Flavobacterium sp.]|uniref:Signal peptidase n=2 Tax=Flavobacterium chungnamense TaxID=706182 RepID=A0ABP7UM25_9FLAO
MKKSKNILLVIVIILLLPIFSYTQTKDINSIDMTAEESYPTFIPEMTYGEDGTSANDVAALPIDSYLWVLLLLGTIYVFDKFFIVYKKPLQ